MHEFYTYVWQDTKRWFWRFLYKWTGITWLVGLFKWSGPLYPLRILIGKPAPVPFQDARGGFDIIDGPGLFEEERFRGFTEGHFYPVRIGDVLHDRYTIIAKLGYGLTSTVWLAGDLEDNMTVVLKVYIRDDYKEKFNHAQNEIRAINTLMKIPTKHRGRKYLRDAISSFRLDGPNGEHTCIVQGPTWQTIEDLRKAHCGVLPPILVKVILNRILPALDFLHTECKLIHTDIKGENIFQIFDKSAVKTVYNFAYAEMMHPSSRKYVDGKTIFASRRFSPPQLLTDCVLGDFGAALAGDQERHHCAQPECFRAPEVMLQADWSYPVDIWNLGVLVWYWVQGEVLFDGGDPKSTDDECRYSTRNHLANVISVLGFPPLDFVKRGRRSHEFFHQNGLWRAKDFRPKSRPWDKRDLKLQGYENELFLDFMRCMLRWRPEDRMTAAKLSEHPWINTYTDAEQDVMTNFVDDLE
ncbi:hypothetical protein N7466_005495 [Penicillium verhagenii]|uniref:uncharacterized protein n=1 Tax=Penicillium verhagenii TaxID=1562060 RepID=UPI0025456FE6|nr:uncharacterized protein N7466_005495 [Penicillium verhagenii]KAJ5930002.1 hypothetical protein N7466_005495 [Penicillium verhagenii]